MVKFTLTYDRNSLSFNFTITNRVDLSYIRSPVDLRTDYVGSKCLFKIGYHHRHVSSVSGIVEDNCFDGLDNPLKWFVFRFRALRKFEQAPIELVDCRLHMLPTLFRSLPFVKQCIFSLGLTGNCDFSRR